MSKKLNYLGFCDKYGESKVIPAALTLPAIFNQVAGSFLDYQANPFQDIRFATLGVVAAIVTHAISNSLLSEAQTGLTRGSRLARLSQGMAYGLTVLYCMASTYSSNPHEKENTADGAPEGKVPATALVSPTTYP